MKTNKYNLFVALALSLMLTACDDALRLTDPQSVDEGAALSSDENVKLVLNGTYDALSSGDFYGGNLLRNSELLAANGEIVFSGTYIEPSEIYAKTVITANANVADAWIAGYRVINMANNVLEALPVVKEEDRTQVRGEALFLRGTAYFELVRMFGKNYTDGNPATNDGVPIVLKPSRGLDERITMPRDKVKDVYDRVLDDLTKAVDALDDSNAASRATKNAAKAMLARVYMQMEDYTKARDLANEVITSDKYTLRTTYDQVFSSSINSEDVFAIPVTTADGINNMQTFYGPTSQGGRGDIEIRQKHLDLYEIGDDRLDQFYQDGKVATDIRTSKWLLRFSPVRIIRLAEMHLIRAETNFRLGTTVGATPTEDINDIRERVGLELFDEGVITLADILKERRLELAHEGHRLHDVKRLKETLTEGSRTYSWDDNMLVFPIPQRERGVNGNLTQNPGYGNN